MGDNTAPGSAVSAHAGGGVLAPQTVEVAFGALTGNNNLSDVADPGASRANLRIPALTPAACVATANVALTGLQTVDGYTLAAGDYILLTAQTTAAQNGVWIASASTWTRPTEFPSGVTVKGRTCAVINGTTNGGTAWLLQAPSAGVTIDATSQTWVKTTGAGGASGVSSFNTRTGAVTLTKADVTGTGLAAADVGADAAGAASTVQAASLQKASNLSDVADAGSGRANLRIAALTPAAAVATANVAALSGLAAVDGYTLAAGDYVLLTGQTTASQNGVWVAAAGAWSRPTEFPSAGSVKGRTCAVINGTVNAGSVWLLQAPSAGITIDTTSQTWTKTSQSGASGTGAGLPSNVVTQTGTYTASANDFVRANTTSAGFTVTLPASPAVGALVAVKNEGTAGNTLTIAPGGTGGNIDGDPTATTTTQYAGAVFEHVGSNVWRIAASMTTTGPQGPTGATGPQGPTGATGAQGPAGTNGAISLIQNNGTAMTVRPTLDFVGATVTDDAANTRTVITISGGSGTAVPGPAKSLIVGSSQTAPLGTYSNNQNLTANLLIIQPFWLAANATAVSLAVKVNASGSTGSVGRFGIYADNGNQKPGSLILDAGTASLITAGTVASVTISQALSAGLIWLAFCAQGSPTTNPTFYSWAASGYNSWLPDTPNNLAANSTFTVAYSVASVTGALPASPSLTAVAASTPLPVISIGA